MALGVPRRWEPQRYGMGLSSMFRKAVTLGGRGLGSREHSSVLHGPHPWHDTWTSPRDHGFGPGQAQPHGEAHGKLHGHQPQEQSAVPQPRLPPRGLTKGPGLSKARDQGSSSSSTGRPTLPLILWASWGRLLPWRAKTLVGVDAAPGGLQLPSPELEQSGGTHRGQLPSSILHLPENVLLSSLIAF